MIKQLTLRILLARLLLLCGTAQAADFNLVYPRPVSGLDRRSEYPIKLLELALSKSGASYTLMPSQLVMNKARVAVELAQGHEINVGWMVTSAEREGLLHPIRICIFKGLGGWRVALIRKADLPQFAKIKNLADLRRYSAGQQADWPDTAILQASDIKVQTTSAYDPLFKMLIYKRFDWFPRSIPEIWAEAEAYKKENLVVEPHLLIRYPSAYYFFVNKRDTALAKALEKGLEAALKDGSFDRIFRDYHGDVIKLADVRKRLVIDLPNPYLPPATPLGRKELWFRVDQAK